MRGMQRWPNGEACFGLDLLPHFASLMLTFAEAALATGLLKTSSILGSRLSRLAILPRGCPMGMRIRPSRESITQSQREHIGFGVALIGLTSRLQAVPRVWSGALSPAPESSFVRFDSDREERRLAASEYHSDAGSGSPQSQLGTSVGRTLVLLDVIRRYCGAVIIGRRPLRRQTLSQPGRREDLWGMLAV